MQFILIKSYFVSALGTQMFMSLVPLVNNHINNVLSNAHDYLLSGHLC